MPINTYILRLGAIRILVLTSLLAVIPVFVSGQQQRTRTARKAQQSFAEAIHHLQQGNYGEAKTGLIQVVTLDNNFVEAHQTLADIYRRHGEFATATNHYRRVLNLNPELTPTTWFGLGESLLLTGQYQEALDVLIHYESLIPDQPERTKLSSKYIADCRFSLAYLKDLQQREQQSDSLRPVNLGPIVNTDMDEYFPKLTADQQTLIFTRKSDQQENFFQTTVGPDGEWQAATILRGSINSDRFNEGAHCISPDGKYLYFTGCNRPDGLGSCDIYVSRREGAQWGRPRNLGPNINTQGWEAQPALSADGQILYFVSNRQGGEGGYDIWKSRLDERGNWGEPINLGPMVNTAFDESAPYIHADNQTLYFSSNGWPGFGNKDIFRSTRDRTGRWQIPVNMGFPINDHTEQSAWAISMNGEQAYFSSRYDRGEGGLDIYRVDLPPALRPDRVAYLSGEVLDAESREPIPDVLIQVTNVKSSVIAYYGYSDNIDGTFLAPLASGGTYAFHINHPGYLLYSRAYVLDDSTNVGQDAYLITVELVPARSGHTEILQNVFFQTNKHDLLEESKTELTQLYEFLLKNPTLGIEIGGHTDSTGEEQANQLLSEKRANAVRKYLINLGISADRIRSAGHGQHQPIEPNDTVESRRKNRRTDFKIFER